MITPFKNNSAMSWWSVLLVEETRVPAKNYRLVGNPNNPVVILRFAISSSSDSADRGRSIIRVNLSETTQPLSHNIVSNRVYISMGEKPTNNFSGVWTHIWLSKVTGFYLFQKELDTVVCHRVVFVPKRLRHHRLSLSILKYDIAYILDHHLYWVSH